MRRSAFAAAAAALTFASSVTLGPVSHAVPPVLPAATLIMCNTPELSRDSSNPQFRVVHWNIKGYYGLSTAEINKRIDRLDSVLEDGATNRASIYGLTEVNNAVNGHSGSDAQRIASKLGSSFDYYPKASTANRKTQAVIWDKDVWTLQANAVYVFTSGNDWVHGFVNVRLKHKVTGKQVNVLEYHLEEPENSEGTESQKQAIRVSQWNQMKGKFTTWSNPVVVLGDTNWHVLSGGSYVSNKVTSSDSRTPFESMARSSNTCSPRVESISKTKADYGTTGNYAAGGTAYDFGQLHGSFAMRGYRLLNGSSASYNSDHHMITLNLTSGSPA